MSKYSIVELGEFNSRRLLEKDLDILDVPEFENKCIEEGRIVFILNDFGEQIDFDKEFSDYCRVNNIDMTCGQ